MNKLGSLTIRDYELNGLLRPNRTFPGIQILCVHNSKTKSRPGSTKHAAGLIHESSLQPKQPQLDLFREQSLSQPTAVSFETFPSLPLEETGSPMVTD